MGKSITDYIKAQGEGLPKQLSELHFDEIQEFAVYDCTSRQNRREILGKRVRKVYVDEPICLKLVFKNDLGLSMHLQNIRAICHGGKYAQVAQSLVITPSQTTQVLLKIYPQSIGDIEVREIQWELFDCINCSKEIDGTKFGQTGKPLKFKVIEASCEAKLEVVFDK